MRTTTLIKVAEAQSQQQLTPSSRSGSTAPARRSSPTSTPSTGWATTRASAPSAKSAGPRPLPHAGRAARRDRRQDRNQKIDVVGTDTQYVVDTFGRPRRISHRPAELGAQVHAGPAGAHRHPQGPATGGAGRPDRRAGRVSEGPEANPQSSLASYRIGELLFTQRNYQASVNSYRDALRGDGEPRWTEVWSHIALGKIFDITGQRDRAVNEYRLAVQTNDNTQGASTKPANGCRSRIRCSNFNSPPPSAQPTPWKPTRSTALLTPCPCSGSSSMTAELTSFCGR
jgi:hypothetical protein